MTPYDKLFQLFAQSRDLSVVRGLVSGTPEVQGILELEELFSACESLCKLNPQEFANAFRPRISNWPVEVQRVCFWRYLSSQASSPTLSRDLESIARALNGTTLDEDRLTKIAIRTVEAALGRQKGNASQAIVVLEECVRELSAMPKSVVRETWRGEAFMQLGYTYQVRGNFSVAERHMRRSIALGAQYGLTDRWLRNGVLASLLWASGQFRLALRKHSSPKARAHATAMHDHIFLAWSYLCACKCAIDLKAITRAKAELELLERVLDLPEAFPPQYRGFAILFRAQIWMLEEKYDKSAEGLKEALRVFEAMEPPFHEGALDTKISMATFAFLSKDYALACATVAKVLEDAEAKGCVNARSRLMVLESCLVVSQNPPLRAGYDDLVHRVHLINNPRLLFLALVNLYHFALEHLTPADQKFLLARIRNLKPLLKKSCYEELYREYVSDTYRDVFEQRLDDIPELTWPETESDEPDDEDDDA